jgi:hypothetical protein
LARKKKKPRQRRQRPPDILRLANLPRRVEETPRWVDDESLRWYHEHLSARLRFPFPALHVEPTETGRYDIAPIMVLELLSAEAADVQAGLMVEAAFGEEAYVLPLADIQAMRDDPADQAIRDYIAWLDETPRRDEDASDDALPFDPASLEPKRLLWAFLRLALYCAGAGAVLNAILTTVGGADLGAIIGSAILGLLGLLLGMQYASMAAPPGKRTLTVVSFGLFGLAAGAMVGALAGGLLVAFVGALPGVIVGALLFARLRRGDVDAKWIGALAGAIFGGMFFALYRDKDAAFGAVGMGLLLGLGGIVLLLVLLIVALTMLYRAQGRQGE